MNRRETGVMVGQASSDIAAGRELVLQGVLKWDRAGIEPVGDLIAAVSGIDLLAKVATDLADRYPISIDDLPLPPKRWPSTAPMDALQKISLPTHWRYTNADTGEAAA